MSHVRARKCTNCFLIGHTAFFCRTPTMYVGHRKTAPVRKGSVVEVVMIKEAPIAVYAARVMMSHGLMRSPQVLDKPFNTGRCIGEVRGGSRVDVYQVTGEWARVLCDGRRGYVRICREGETYLRKV